MNVRQKITNIKEKIKMYYCQNCGRETSEKICQNCAQPIEGLAVNETHVYEEPTPVKNKRKGKISTLIGLILMALSDIAAVIVLFAGLFRSTSMTFLEQIADSVASAGLILFLGIWFFGLAKWIAFAVPKTFRASKAIARAIIPLSLLAFVAELMIVIWLTLIPISIYGATLAPATMFLGYLHIAHPENVLLPILFVAIVGVATYFLGRYAVKKVFGNKFAQKSEVLA
jgi:hypothetical protein